MILFLLFLSPDSAGRLKQRHGDGCIAVVGDRNGKPAGPPVRTENTCRWFAAAVIEYFNGFPGKSSRHTASERFRNSLLGSETTCNAGHGIGLAKALGDFAFRHDSLQERHPVTLIQLADTGNVNDVHADFHQSSFYVHGEIERPDAVSQLADGNEINACHCNFSNVVESCIPGSFEHDVAETVLLHPLHCKPQRIH